MISTPELARPFQLSRLIGQAIAFDLRADPDELARVARRLRIEAVGHLEARFSLRSLGAGIVEADGVLDANVTQACVISLEPFEQPVVERFTVRFVPAEPSDDMDPDAIDEIPYEGDRIDLGEAAVEQLALALDPFPRKPGVALPPGLSEDEPADAVTATIHPFADLGRKEGKA